MPHNLAAFQSIAVVTYINLACGRINSDFNTFKNTFDFDLCRDQIQKSEILALPMSSI